VQEVKTNDSSWIDDEEADKACHGNTTNNFHEEDRCKGDNVCVKDKCYTITKACEVGENKKEDRCNTKQIANPGEGCGSLSGSGSYPGVCTDEYFSVCENVVVGGKQCVESVCCAD